MVQSKMAGHYERLSSGKLHRVKAHVVKIDLIGSRLCIIKSKMADQDVIAPGGKIQDGGP